MYNNVFYMPQLTSNTLVVFLSADTKNVFGFYSGL